MKDSEFLELIYPEFCNLPECYNDPNIPRWEIIIANIKKLEEIFNITTLSDLKIHPYSVRLNGHKITEDNVYKCITSQISTNKDANPDHVQP